MKSNTTASRRTASRRRPKAAPASAPDLRSPVTAPAAVSDEPEFDMNDVRPTVIVAPELRGRHDFVVVRDPDDTDADYESRCNLFKLLLDHVERE
jgi:hypothetical protein